MASWSFRQAGDMRSGLTVYQLQELIRSGRATGDGEVTQDGHWRPIRDLPSLARLLPEAAAVAVAAPPSPGEKVVVHGVQLEVGEDGKPRPPSPEIIARLLAAEAAPTRIDKDTSRRVLLVVAAATLGGLLLVGAVIAHATHWGF